MRVSVVAALIVGVHVAVIGSVVMTQGCASTRMGESSTMPSQVEPPPPPVLAPTIAVEAEPVTKVSFPEIKPPVKPESVKSSVAAENVYVIQKGDSLSKIAVRHGVNTRELAELNQISDPNKIRIGQKLILPDYAKPSTSRPGADKKSAAAVAKMISPPADGETYEVKSGDALSKIAARFGLKTKDLMKANNISDANKIRIGQKLVIPGAQAKKSGEVPAAPAKGEAFAAPAPVEEEVVVAEIAPLPAPVLPEAPAPVIEEEDFSDMLDYSVQSGDTIDSIARLFVVRADDIREVNQIPAGTEVKVGQNIKIPPSTP